MRWTLALVCLAIAFPIHAQEQSPPAAETNAEAPNLPGITINREAGYVDVAAKVATRNAEWLELLACTSGTKEYESILAVQAKPRDIHLALMLLGLEPGSPLRFEAKGEEEAGEFIVHAPAGPQVAVTLHYQVAGEPVEMDANRWIMQQDTGEVMSGNIWLFAGSQIKEIDSQSVYLADVNGSVISLVNFGDDLLARDTSLTKDNDGKALTVRTTVIPEIGTPVTIRLTPVKPSEPVKSPESAEPAPADPTGKNSP